MAKLTYEEILAYLDEATILELNGLVKAIEEKYGVSAAAPVAVAAAPAEAEEQGPTSVTVTMTAFGETKVKVIKAPVIAGEELKKLHQGRVVAKAPEVARPAEEAAPEA